MHTPIARPGPKKPHLIDVEVGRRIRLQRIVSGLSQSTLADALGVTFQQVQKYEKGANRVGASRLSDIARVLGVPVSFFFPDAESPDESVSPIAAAITQFVSSDEGLKLNTAFAQIASSKIRKQVVDLVKAIADCQDDATQAGLSGPGC